jgi:hypothetical protein
MSLKQPTKNETEEYIKNLAAVHAFYEKYPMFKDGMIEMCEYVILAIEMGCTVEQVKKVCEGIIQEFDPERTVLKRIAEAGRLKNK